MRSFEPSFLKKQKFSLSLLNTFFLIQKSKERLNADRLSFPYLYHQLEKEQADEKQKRNHHTLQENQDFVRAAALIHKKNRKIPFNTKTILSLHKLALFSQKKPKGIFKTKNNRIRVESKIARGVVRCLPHYLCKKYMRELHKRFKKTWDSGEYDPLVLIAAWKVDFFLIHPFADGNGRTGRLILMLLLYHADHDICRYVNLANRICKKSNQFAYPLLLAGIHWKKGKHELSTSCEYLTDLVLQSYQEIEKKIAKMKAERLMLSLKNQSADRL